MQELLYLLLSLREPLLLPQMLAEGKGGGGNHLEVLDSEGDSHYGDAEKKSTDEVDCRDFPESAENPDYVHRNREAARFFLAEFHLASEGPHDIIAQLEQLDSERNADYGYAHQQTHKIVEEG